MGVTLVVHGHFYQPPRENPWTEEVEREPSAAPFHDWNERITEECYRPNAAARIVDERGLVHGIVDNYASLSFDVGPTLFSWLDGHAPDVAAAMTAHAGGAIAQAYSHLILPLANERDIRTQIRWGLADFRHRFGREAEAMWLPECAVDGTVLGILAEEGVRATVLAPGQIAAVRALDARGAPWVEVAMAPDVSRPFRWSHPERPDLSVDLVVYDGALSHDVAFGLDKLSSAQIIDRATREREGLAVIATDGETFGHHHRWGERAIAYALGVEAPQRGVEVDSVVGARASVPATHEARVRTSAWSCAHGVERWRSDCGCSTGGDPGWHQRWRAPLRAALDLVHDALDEVFDRRGKEVFRDPWAARDAYVDVVLRDEGLYPFVSAHVVGDRVVALTLLEAQRHGMAMYTSCGWFFNDLAGIETIQVLRYAARALDLLADLGEGPGEAPVLEVLAQAASNRPEEGTGADIWRRHVAPVRVAPWRVAAHLALVSVLGGAAPPKRIGAWDVVTPTSTRAERGALVLTTGVAGITHRRTSASTWHAYAALRLGGLEVVGAVRGVSAGDRDGTGADAVASIRRAFLEGAPVTQLLVLLSEVLEGQGFGIEAALPGRVEDLLGGVAEALTARVGAQLDHVLADARPTLDALAAAGFPLPPELERVAEVALARRIEAMVAAQGGSTLLQDYEDAVALARSPLGAHVAIDSPRARRLLGDLLNGAATKAATGTGEEARGAAAFAVAVRQLADDLGVQLSIDRAQEVVYRAVQAGRRPDLRALAAALHLAPPA